MRLTICLMRVRIQWAVWWGILLYAGSQALQHNLLLGWYCGVSTVHHPRKQGSQGLRSDGNICSFSVNRFSNAMTSRIIHPIPLVSPCSATLGPLLGPEMSLIRVKCMTGLALPSTWIVENMFRGEQLEKGCEVQPPGSAASNVFQNFLLELFYHFAFLFIIIVIYM